MRWWWIALGLVGCDGNDPHDCDAGTPTCDSTLKIQFGPGDARTEFTLHVSDETGMKVDMDCPDTEPGVFGGYTATCGSGYLTITAGLPIGDDVLIGVEEGQPITYHPSLSRGGDFCGNECDQGTITL